MNKGLNTTALSRRKRTSNASTNNIKQIKEPPSFGDCFKNDLIISFFGILVH